MSPYKYRVWSVFSKTVQTKHTIEQTRRYAVGCLVKTHRIGRIKHSKSRQPRTDYNRGHFTMDHNWNETMTGNSTKNNLSETNVTDDDNKDPMLAEDNTISILHQTKMIFHIVVLLIGMMGNITTVILMKQKKWMSATTRIILTALAVSDTLTIITHTFNQKFLYQAIRIDLRALSDYGCKICFIIYRTSKMTSSWFTVFLCFERFIAIIWPHKMSLITVGKVKICVGTTYAALICFNVIMSFSNIVKDGLCQKNDPTFFGLSTLRGLIFTEMLIYSMIPIAITLILTPMTVRGLIRHYRMKQNSHSQLNGNLSRAQKQLQELVRTTTTLIAVMLNFIVTIFPITIVQIQAFQQQDSYSQGDLFKFIAQRLEQINYSINFFLYFLTSPSFRRYFINYLKSCYISACTCKQQS